MSVAVGPAAKKRAGFDGSQVHGGSIRTGIRESVADLMVAKDFIKKVDAGFDNERD
jgi:hypothetical protein